MDERNYKISRGRFVLDNPTVSVIIPSYNVARYIREGLESVFAQTYKNFEILVVNDGSPDSEELRFALEPFWDLIVYIEQANRGLGGARNTGVRQAKAPLIALLDPDDVWLPEFLSFQIQAMAADANLAVCYTNAILFGDPTFEGRTFMDDCPSAGEVTFETLVSQRCIVLTPSVVIRREMLCKVGLFDESLTTGEDFDLWIRVAKARGRFSYSRETLVRYRKRPDSLSANRVALLENAVKILDKSERDMVLTLDESKAVAKSRESFRGALLLEKGKFALVGRDYPVAYKLLSEASSLTGGPKLKLGVALLGLAPRLADHSYRAYLWMTRQRGKEVSGLQAWLQKVSGP